MNKAKQVPAEKKKRRKTEKKVVKMNFMKLKEKFIFQVDSMGCEVFKFLNSTSDSQVILTTEKVIVFLVKSSNPRSMEAKLHVISLNWLNKT